MTELLKCPFCWGEARIERTDCIGSINYHYCYCIQCGARTDEFATKKGAIEAWNKRVPQTWTSKVFERIGKVNKTIEVTE